MEEKPLCFVLPSAMKDYLQELHKVYSSQVVREGDVLLNVFPKHQEEVEAFNYPVDVETVLDPSQFLRRICGCRAVISSRLHGAILGLHSGIPTLAAWPLGEGSKVPGLMKDVMHFPEQFLLVNQSLTRDEVDLRVTAVQQVYERQHRQMVFKAINEISRHTLKELHLLLEGPFKTKLNGPSYFASQPQEFRNGTTDNFWASDVYNSVKIKRPNVNLEQASGSSLSALPIFVDGKRGANSAGANAVTDQDADTDATEGRDGPQGQDGQEREEALVGEYLEDVGGVTSWKRRWGMDSSPIDVRGGGREVFFADTLAMTLGTILLIGLLGTLLFSSLTKSDVSHDSTAHLPLAAESPMSLNGGSAGAGLRRDSFHRLRLRRVVFFGINYILWIVLAIGFNISSKVYLRKTRNPVALLAIQGWVGIIVMWVVKFLPWCTRSSAATPTSNSTYLPISSTKRLIGKFNFRQVRAVNREVWLAGLMHCVNAALTSWSVFVGGIAATHALKALEPVAAAGFSRLLLGTSLPPQRLLAVAVIVLGLVILMLPSEKLWWTGMSAEVDDDVRDPELNMIIPGIMTTCACCAIALRNVFIKRVDPPPSPPFSLLICSIVAATVGSVVILMPWLPFSWTWAGQPLVLSSGVNASLCFVGYNLASFNLLRELTPIGHAVGNASKRVCLFAAGFFLGEEGPLSMHQEVGTSIAFIGLAGYNLSVAWSRSS